MTASIGNALFGKIAMESFNRIAGEVSDLQAQISSGKNDPRPSADPMRAAAASTSSKTGVGVGIGRASGSAC